MATPDDCGVHGNLVANCGFETGDLTAWSPSGPGTVSVSGAHVYAGSDAVDLSSGSIATVAQTVYGTQAGKVYDFSFWVTGTNEKDILTATIDGVDGGHFAYVAR